MVKSKRLDTARREAMKQARAEAGPTPELRAQVEAVASPVVNRKAYRPAWKVESRLDGLARIGAIRRSAYVAAQTFADDFHLAHGGSATDLAGAGGGGSVNFDPSFPQVAAMSRIRRAQDRIGPVAAFLIIQCACLDAPWTHTARLLGASVDMTKAATIEALAALDEPSVKGRRK